MPAQAQSNPFLVPQRAGEEVPDSQIKTQGPFSAELTQPANVRPSGYGGMGEGLLHFANQFLAGASEGRLRQFQQSEQTKKEHERNYDATVQHIMDSPQYTRDFKEQVYQDALRTKASAGMAAMGKGGKNDHPLLNVARGMLNHAIGPSENIKHQDIGPEHVSDLISQMHDPKNVFDLANVSDAAGTGVGQAIENARKVGADKGIQLYQEDVPNLPGYKESVNSIVRQGMNPMAIPGVASQVAALPHRPTAADLAKQDIPWVYTDPQSGSVTKTTVRKGADNVYRDLSGTPIPSDDPRLTHGGAAGPYDVAQARAAGQATVQGMKNAAPPKEAYQLRQDANGNWVRIQTGGFPRTPTPPVGAAPASPAVTAAPPGATPPPTEGQPQETPTAGAPPSEMENKVRDIATRNGLDPSAALAIAYNESRLNPNAVSPKGAVGIMQLMPDTAKSLGVTDPIDPDQNIEAGVKYYKQLLDKYGGDQSKALAAYNMGPAALDSGRTLPDETKKYVAQVTKDQQTFANTGGANAAGSQPTATTPQPPRNRNEGIVSTGIVKPSANAPVNWTPEQNTLAQAPVQPGGRREEFLKTWPYQDQLLIKSIADYDYKAPGGTKGALTSPRVSSMIASAKAYNPTFSASDYDNRAAMKKNFTFGGKGAENITSLNTALVHLGGLDDAATTLDNSAFRKYNTFANFLVKESGSPQAKAFQNDRTVVSEELARALKGGVATEAEVKQWEHNIDTSDSPAQLKTSTQTIGKIIAGRLGEQQSTYERAMGEPPKIPFVSPAAQKVLTRLGAAPSGPLPNPNPAGFVKGHRYRNMEYLGGDPNNQASWKQ